VAQYIRWGRDDRWGAWMTSPASEFGDTNLQEMMDWAVARCPLGVSLLDTHMRHLRLNAEMCRILGLRTEAEGLNMRPTDLLSGPGAESCVASARRVIRTGTPDVWRGMLRLPGERRDQAVEVFLSPAKGPDGLVHGLLVVGFDVTEEHRARERLALVDEANTRIGSTLDMTKTAEEIVGVAVPRLADLAMIDLLESVVRGDEPVTGRIEGTVPLRRLALGSVLEGAPEAVILPGDAASYPADSPVAECLETGRTLSCSGADNIAQWANVSAARTASIIRYQFKSMALVPIRARGRTLGVAVFTRHQRQERFTRDDLLLAEEIIARAAVCLDNARRYTREHATALALQRSLLQQRKPDQSAVEVATRYLPAHSGVAVGGDWFDVIRLSGCRVALVVGDVAGHGIHAAATMGRLRTAVQTLADVDLEPEELLTRLDDVVARLAAEQELSADTETDLSATCLYAVYDSVSRRCTMARAGHPVPAVLTPDGVVDYLDLPAGPPLGLGGLPFEEAEVELPEGSLLVLYTDGLIESRQRDIDAGLNAMRKVLTDVRLWPDDIPRTASSLDAICDSLLASLLPEQDQAVDDAALLVARTHALPADRIASWDLPADPRVVAVARARAARQLAVWGLEDISFTTELLVSELVTNAIRHAHQPIQLRIILDGSLNCEVFDGSISAPHLRRADRYDEGGRGLMLVAQLAERWGTRHTSTGKVIWAQQPLPGRPAEFC
jgi:serine phosphatase RsbU (regulator of sigma subunit)/anti-sigma regulatory factor (Ser/Thr protein kinase)